MKCPSPHQAFPDSFTLQEARWSYGKGFGYLYYQSLEPGRRSHFKPGRVGHKPLFFCFRPLNN